MSEETADETHGELAVDPRKPRAGWHPLAWLIVGVLALILPYGLLAALSRATRPIGPVVLPILAAGLAILIYRVLMAKLAKRPLPELAAGPFARETLSGLAVGVAFVGGSAGLVDLLGGYRFVWAPAAPIALLSILTINCAAAVIEELVFRGVAFQAIEQMGGRFTALAVTSLFFGIAHLGNPNATAWSAFAIACEAGLLLGAAFLWRRHLGFVMGLHFGWNAVEALLGIPVSGHTVPGLLRAELTGSELLTGGSFGLEDSLVPVIASLFLSIPMLFLANRRPHGASGITAIRENGDAYHEQMRE